MPNLSNSQFSILNSQLTISLCILAIIAVQTFASVEKALEYAYKAEYSKALSEVAKIPEEDSSACVIRGMVLFSRFDDLGDTLDLNSALSILEKCKAGDFWEPLRRYEIALVNDRKSNTFNFKGIIGARSAAQIFATRSDIDSKAFYAIYTYYAPFNKSNLEDLRKGFDQSEMFSAAFGSALIWIFDREKKYAEALNLTNEMLKRYPEHPILLQTKAEMLFKTGKAEEAIELFKQSEQLYAQRAPNSIRYWCAVTHLAKMTGDSFWKEKLKSKEHRAIKRWMPDIK
ncbi:MAG: hypothetical protein LBU89_06300 [Fibromonadaceae bacterium]|jgi:tetratricopeptide (TPR) repeat protein|nr:hypothetical protein [Fibromonadaceae bacterium]